HQRPGNLLARKLSENQKGTPAQVSQTPVAVILFVIVLVLLLVIDLPAFSITSTRKRKERTKTKAQESHHLRIIYMINPNGDEYTEDDPLAASMRSSEERGSEEQTPGRFRQATDKVSHIAGDAWEQTKERASVA